MQEERGPSLNEARLMELYKIAVEEYRFQVTLNAARSRDYLVLNSAIIAAGVTLLGQKSNLLAGAVFVAGFCVAALTGFVTHTQHNYYRETRETKKLLERRLGIGGQVVKTTPSAGSRRWRLGSVTQFNYTILALLCAVNLCGALFGFSILQPPIERPLKTTHITAKTPPATVKQHRPQPSKSAPVQPIAMPTPRRSATP